MSVTIEAKISASIALCAKFRNETVFEHFLTRKGVIGALNFIGYHAGDLSDKGLGLGSSISTWQAK